jgi:putative phosphoesterase
MERAMRETAIEGRRFGITSDTHSDKRDWPATLAALLNAWGQVDAILHCGDITTTGALEDLAAAAPTFATRSSVDPPAIWPSLADGPRVLLVGEERIGLTFNLPEAAASAEGAAQLFGKPVAVCVFGGTHSAEVSERGGVLFLNPGSPSLAKVRTAAVLTLGGGRPTAEIVPIG